jgi:hypothetical protein
MKRFYVSFLVEANKLHDLLMEIEVFDVANVEVRSVAEIINAQSHKKRSGYAVGERGIGIEALRAAVMAKSPISTKELGEAYAAAGKSKKGLHTSIALAIGKGWLKRAGRSMYKVGPKVRED